MLSSLRLAVSLLTRLPTRVERVDNTTVGRAMTLAPVVGAALGAVAAAVVAGASWCVHGETLLPAAIGVTVLTLGTGALHLDGLADTADALGVRGDADAARAAAKAATVGVFGIVAVALSLLLDVTAVATSLGFGRATTALVTGCSAGRLAATWACVSVPAASATGLGAWVATTVSRTQALVASAFLVAVAGITAWLDVRAVFSVVAIAAVVVALVVGAVVRRIGCRRFGGLTGDVLGAVIACASTAAYLTVALTPRAG